MTRTTYSPFPPPRDSSPNAQHSACSSSETPNPPKLTYSPRSSASPYPRSVNKFPLPPISTVSDKRQNHLAAAFSPGHDITQELELDGQNSRLIIHTSPNFGSGDEQAYTRVCDFLKARQSPSADRIHCIWYCVACDEDRGVHGLEADFLAHLRSAADTPPAVLVFTKYEELVGRARLEWSRDERRSGAASSVAVSHLIGDLASRRFEERIGGRWDGIVGGGRVARVCVASDDGGDGGVGGGRSGFDTLTATTVAALKNWNAKLAFAAAQRNSPSISTQCE